MEEVATHNTRRTPPNPVACELAAEVIGLALVASTTLIVVVPKGADVLRADEVESVPGPGLKSGT